MGLPEYQWGSPVFRKVTVAQENGRTFVLEAPEASADTKYIQSVAVDDTVREGTSLAHDDLARGARVVVTMGTRPNKARGQKGGK